MASNIVENAWQFNKNVCERNQHMFEYELATDAVFKVSSFQGKHLKVFTSFIECSNKQVTHVCKHTGAHYMPVNKFIKLISAHCVEAYAYTMCAFTSLKLSPMCA